MKMKLLLFFTLIIFWGGLQSLSPLTLTIAVLWTSLIVSMLTLANVHKWFFYAVALFYLGGMMILFVYIVSLLSSEKIINFFPQKKVVLIFGIFVMAVNPWSMVNICYQISSIYKPFESISPSILALALLMILIIVVKLCDMWSGPLKSYMNE